jgi:O-antigen/teichoic acid export membrane protein
MIKSIFATSGTNAIIVVINIVTGILLARLLGPAHRGELAAAQAFPTMVSGIALIGLPQAVTYWISREPERSKQTVTASLLLFGPIVTATILLVYFLSPYALAAQSPEVVRDARIYSLVVFGASFGSIYMWVLQGLQRFKYWNLLRLFPGVVWLLAIVIGYVTGNLSITFLIVFALLFPLPSVFVLNAVLWKHLSGSIKLIRVRLFDLVKYGLPVTLTSIPQTLNLRLDQILMGAILDPGVLGLYVVGVTWSGASSLLLGAIGSVVFPSMAMTRDIQEQQRIVRTTTRVSTLLALTVVVFQAIFTPVIFPLLFGSAYAPAVPSAIILVVAGGVAGLNALWKDILLGLGLPRMPMYAEIVGLVTTVLFLSLLLRPYQLMGAAVASLLSYATTLGYLSYVIHNQVQLSFRQMVVPSTTDYQLILTGMRRIARSIIPAE